MLKWISVLSSMLFLLVFSALQAGTIEPDQHRKALENFKKEYKQFNMAMKTGKTETCSQLLSSLVDKVEKEYARTKEKNQWFDSFKCSSLDRGSIAYQLNGRVTKQKEIVAGLSGLAQKEKLDTQELESADRYLNFLYYSMKENVEESEKIASSCGL